MPIHSVYVDLLLHSGSACIASIVLVASTNVMALVLPTNRSLFYAGDINWLKRWGFSCFLSGGDSVASLFFWKHFLGDIFVGGKLPSFCLPFFWIFLVYCCMMHCHFVASFA